MERIAIQGREGNLDELEAFAQLRQRCDA